MFNFNVFAKALVDSNLSDGEFRLLCLILNNMALNNKEEIEMYNAFVAFHLDKCEKSVQNLMKGLCEKNYITREIIGTSKNRRGNIIMINETMQEMMMEKNYTLYNDYMERKNFPDNEETKQEKNCTLYNDYIKNNKSILINSEKSIEENIDYIDLDEANNKSDTSTNDVSNEENNETISIDSITSTEGSKPIETQTPSTNDESNTSINVSNNESNKSISADETIKWLNSKLDEYYKTKRPNQSQSIEINITNYFQSIDKHNFNPNQLRAISALEKRFNGIKSQKQKYFSKWNKTNTSINSNDTLSKESTHNLISADEIEQLPWEVSEEVKPISDVTSTDGKADTVSVVQNDTISTSDRLTYPQPVEKTPTPNGLEDFLKRVKSAIHKGVYDWSLTLDERPTFLTGDDINSVVVPALRSQADVNDYLGKFILQDLNDYAHEQMENRLNNPDMPSIIRKNQYEKRHKAAHEELIASHNNLSAFDNENKAIQDDAASDKQINQNSRTDGTINDDFNDDDLPF